MLWEMQPLDPRSEEICCRVPFVVYKQANLTGEYEFSHSGSRLIPVLRAPKSLLSHDGVSTLQKAYASACRRHACLVLENGSTAVKYCLRDKKKQSRPSFEMEGSGFEKSAEAEKQSENASPHAEFFSWLMAYEQAEGDSLAFLSTHDHIATVSDRMPSNLSLDQVGGLMDRLGDLATQASDQNRFFILRDGCFNREYIVSAEGWTAVCTHDEPEMEGPCDGRCQAIAQDDTDSSSRISSAGTVLAGFDGLKSHRKLELSRPEPLIIRKSNQAKEGDDKCEPDSMSSVLEALHKSQSVEDLAKELNEFLLSEISVS